MRRVIFFSLIATIGILTGLALVGYFRFSGAQASCGYVHSSLKDATLQEVEDSSKNFACTFLDSEGEIKTRLVRFMRPEEFMSFFGDLSVACRDEQLALVILQGDFGSHFLGGGLISDDARQKATRNTFVGLVFDVNTGNMLQVTGSVDGSAFREILDDESLPENPLALVPPLDSLPPCTDKGVAPTVMPPSRK